MFHLALRGVRHNVGRYVATLLAILTGVAFFSASGFLGDRVTQALEGDVDRQYSTVDVAIVFDQDATTADNLAEKPTIPGTAVERFLAVDGVEAGAGILTGPVAFLGVDGKVFGDGSTGRLWIADDELNPLSIEEGSPPTGADEVSVDKGLAEREGLSVGDSVTVLSVSGEHPATIVGITRFGTADALDSGGTVSIPEAAAFDWLRDGLVEYDTYYLRGSGDAAQLVAEIAPDVPPGFKAQTGEEFRADQRSQVGQIGTYLKTALQFFSALALFVGAFVIYNTFSVIVAQRQRELAVLSAIGATPKQIKRSLRYEGLLVGLLGSVLGVIVGIGLTFLMSLALSTFGVDLPGSGVVVSASTVVPAVVLGTLITLFSVMVPARRAARIEPIEALRQADAEGRTVSRPRGVVAVAMAVLGVLGLFLSGSVFGVGLSALLLVVGMILAGPFIAIVGSRLARPVMSRFGLEGRLAADNSARNPKRTATTANALLIGVFLVTLVTVAGTSLKDFATEEIQKLQSADYLIQSDGGTIDPGLIAELESVPGVEGVTPYRREAVTIDGTPSLVSTADTGALVEVADVKAEQGSLDDLVDGTIAVSSGSGETVPEVGATVTVADSSGESIDLEVVAVLEFSLDSGSIGNLVTTATFDSLVGDTAPTAAFIDAQSGAQSDTKDAIDEIVSRRPDITVLEGNALGRLVGSVFDFIINAVNGLLLMSVLVALIGIVNTLSLSILERRRELGLLRVMGMVDRRVQRMVRLESGLISALGTVTGVVLGLLVGLGLIASIARLTDAGISFSLPTTRILVVLVLGVVLGVLASFLPARRSTRLEVLDAIQAT